MSASFGGKIWEYPYELRTHELQEAIELLWATYAFDDGSQIVSDLMKACEIEFYRRNNVVGTQRVRIEWSEHGWPKWPKEGTPVLELIFNNNHVKSCKAVYWSISFMGENPYIYTEEHHYD